MVKFMLCIFYNKKAKSQNKTTSTRKKQNKTPSPQFQFKSLLSWKTLLVAPASLPPMPLPWGLIVHCISLFETFLTCKVTVYNLNMSDLTASSLREFLAEHIMLKTSGCGDWVHISTLLLNTVWPLASILTTLGFYGLICKMAVMTAAISQGCVEELMRSHT
jgi:hypothetical protein